MLGARWHFVWIVCLLAAWLGAGAWLGGGRAAADGSPVEGLAPPDRRVWLGAPVYPPGAPPFSDARRAFLASTVLLFPHADDEPRLEEGVFVLPAPLPWPPGAAAQRAWELDVPGNLPIFLLAALTPGAQGLLPDRLSVVIDGSAVPAPEAFVVRGLHLPDAGGVQEFGAVALVLAAPEPGRHSISVACSGCALRSSAWLATVNAGPRTYLLNVLAPKLPPPIQIVASLAPERPATDASVAPESLPAPAEPPAERDRPPADTAPGERDRAGPGGAPAPESVPAPSVEARRGLIADREFSSESLGRTMPYRIYLPPGYNQAGAEEQAPSRRYPVLYLLHGLGGSARQWTDLGLAEELDRLAAGGGWSPWIVVMPAGRAGYWVNHADGGPRWGDYVARDLVAHVDATYRTIPRREARAIGGLSMGGHGALQLALNYPDVFGVAGAHSPSLRGADSAPAYFGGESGFARRDPISLVRQSQVASPPLIWIDVGQDDFWRSAAEALHQALLERGWAHEWRVYAGEHDGWYWGDHLWEYLPFYNAAFQKLGVPLTR
jgi:S-formylglutathione hydrolase FrmB